MKKYSGDVIYTVCDVVSQRIFLEILLLVKYTDLPYSYPIVGMHHTCY